MRKAFAYLRVSGKGQVRGDGFARQSEAVRDYAKAHGIRIIRTFREAGVSGTKELENRPALSEMMAALHGNAVKLVLIEKLDRLARDLMIQETVIGDLRKHGFALISAAEPDLLQDDATRKLMRQMLGAIAEYEKTMLVTKLRGARLRKKARTGRCEGRKPYGYYSGEKRILDRMEALRAQGLGFDQIAKQLATEGLMNRRGKPFGGFAVNRIVARQARRKGHK